MVVSPLIVGLLLAMLSWAITAQGRASTLRQAAVVHLSIAILLTGFVAVVGSMGVPFSQPGNGEGAGVSDTGARVKAITLDCYRVEGKERLFMGTVSAKLGEKPLFTLPFETRVIACDPYVSDEHFANPGSSSITWSIDGTSCSVVTPCEATASARYALS